MKRSLALLIIVLAPVTACAAGRVVVVAGGGTGGDGSVGAEAKVTQPFGIDFSPDGATIYFVEFVGGERLRAIDAQGVVRTLAGTGAKGNTGDGGPGPKAAFNGMHSLAVGPEGVVYLADTWNNRIRTFDPKTGVVAAFAGTGEKGFSGDGSPAAEAKFGGVYCIAFDDRKETLYVADLDNRRIRAIDMKTRVVSTVAGNGKKGVPADGSVAAESPLVDPRAVAVGRHRFVLVLERSGHALRTADLRTGRIVTSAGTGKAGAGLGDGSALLVQFNGPKHLWVEEKGEKFSALIADTENHRILRYTPASDRASIEVVAGTGKKGAALGDGDPLKCQLAQPHGVAVHPRSGEIYIADSSNHRILKIEK